MCKAWHIANNGIRYRLHDIPFWAGILATLSTRIVGILEATTAGLCCVCLSVFVREVCVCVCGCVCVCVWVLASACVRAVHKSTAVNIYRLKFVIDYNNTGIKSKILKINLHTIVHSLRNQAALHCMSDRGYSEGDCFPLGSWESSWDGESERYEWNGWMNEWINEGLNEFINGSGKWASLFIAACRWNIQYTSKYHFFEDGKLILEGVSYFYFSVQGSSDSRPKVSYGIPSAFLVYRQLWERIGHWLGSTSLKRCS